MLPVKQILVPTDFSAPSEVAFAYGRELAVQFRSTLHVLHVAKTVYPHTLGVSRFEAAMPNRQQQIEDDARRQLEALVADPDETAPATVTAVVSAVSPALAIVEYAKAHRIDAIVMGTHGRSGFAHVLMGSVAELVVRTAPCPVLAVKCPEESLVSASAEAWTIHA